MNSLTRCAWARTPLGIAYHDTEWGVPVHDDVVLFEFLTLEGAQAGLSWETILKKREAYREALAGLRPAARGPLHTGTGRASAGEPGHRSQSPQDREHGAQRARRSSRCSASSEASMPTCGALSAERRSLNRWRAAEAGARATPESDALSRDLLRRGFKFVGSTICYAFMQAVGLVNDHTTDCFRHALVGRSHPGARKKPMEIGEDPR